MALSAADRTAITDLISLHGHLTDAGELDRMHELFTDDVVYDVGDLGGGSIQGLAALREAAIALGPANPVGHHVTNVVVAEAGADRAHALSKAIGIMANGTCASLTYRDTLSRLDRGWRISHREIIMRRVPLGG